MSYIENNMSMSINQFRQSMLASRERTNEEWKSNEITVIPELLNVLEIAGCIIAIDAIGCQREIAKKIIEKDAEYVLSLKANQRKLYQDVKLLFDDLEQSDYKAYEYEYVKTTDESHGRIETRECWYIFDLECLRHLRGFANWEKLSTVSRIRSEQRIGQDVSSIEDRYHIASITGTKKIGSPGIAVM